jgi:hypothetical protein
MNTIYIKGAADRTKLRRIALAAQGLHQSMPFGGGLNGARLAIEQLGYVQIDTISVVERAHHHVFHSRVPNFTPAMTNRLLKDREVFEYWHHAAALLPMADYRFSLPYKQAITNGKIHWFKNPDTKLMQTLKQRVIDDGPLRASELEDNRSGRGGWWDWKPAKRALEQLYMQGDLMVSDRDGFQKTYDLTERVLPENVDTTPPSTQEFAEHVITQQIRSHAFVSRKGITYQRRNPALRDAVKQLIDAKLKEGVLDQLVLPNGEIFVADKGMLDKSVPRFSRNLSILSPFDNVLIQRQRLKSVFDFDYQIECYVPEAKREFGYFGLPLLYRDRFVGQVDCKAHRKDKMLEIKALHISAANVDPGAFSEAFSRTIRAFARFQSCEQILLQQAQPKSFAASLQQALQDAS